MLKGKNLLPQIVETPIIWEVSSIFFNEQEVMRKINLSLGKGHIVDVDPLVYPVLFYVKASLSECGDLRERQPQLQINRRERI